MSETIENIQCKCCKLYLPDDKENFSKTQMIKYETKGIATCKDCTAHGKICPVIQHELYKQEKIRHEQEKKQKDLQRIQEYSLMTECEIVDIFKKMRYDLWQRQLTHIKAAETFWLCIKGRTFSPKIQSVIDTIKENLKRPYPLYYLGRTMFEGVVFPLTEREKLLKKLWKLKRERRCCVCEKETFRPRLRKVLVEEVDVTCCDTCFCWRCKGPKKGNEILCNAHSDCYV